jgi:hypothetical protein
MSVQTLSPSKQSASAQAAPPFQAGDRLARAEFERRYQAHPEIKKAELIEGVVYMPSPIRFEQHSSPHFVIITWLGVYQAHTPDLRGAIMPPSAWIWKMKSNRMPCSGSMK